MQINKSLLKLLPNKKYLEMLPDFKQEKTQAFITLVLTLIALSIFVFFAISPTLSTIAQLKKELADNTFVDQQLVQKIANLSLLGQKYSFITNDMPTVLSALPEKPNVPLLAAQIQSLAKKYNVKITRLQLFQVDIYPPVKNSDKSLSFAFSIESLGTSSDLTTFLSSLVNFERVITIDTLSFSKDSIRNELQKLSIRGRAYFKG